MPFQTLISDTSNAQTGDYSNLNYLVYSNPVTTLYSIDQFFSESKYLTWRSRYLGLAPKYVSKNKHGLTTLPGADNEIYKIGKYFEGLSFVRNAATKKNFLNNCSHFDIIHLALHTEINEKDPLYSKLF